MKEINLEIKSSSKVLMMARCSENPGWSVCSVYHHIN